MIVIAIILGLAIGVALAWWNTKPSNVEHQDERSRMAAKSTAVLLALIIVTVLAILMRFGLFMVPVLVGFMLGSMWRSHWPNPVRR